MKYTININQLALSKMKSRINLEEATLLDYLYWLCGSPSEDIEGMRVEKDGIKYTWFNYGFYLKENPILRGKTKATITPRVKALEDEGFITSFQDEITGKKYIKILPKADGLFSSSVNTVQKTKQTRLDSGTDPFRKLNIDSYTIDHYTNDSLAKDELLRVNDLGVIPLATGKSPSTKAEILMPTQDAPIAKEPLFTEKDVNHLLGVFNKHNPAVGYVNKTQRNAIKGLLSQYTTENAEYLINEAFRIQGLDFAPTITTPYEMYQKLIKLENFLKKEK